jgi:hypothetical protein
LATFFFTGETLPKREISNQTFENEVIFEALISLVASTNSDEENWLLGIKHRSLQTHAP